jgi:hypothetical protein
MAPNRAHPEGMAAISTQVLQSSATLNHPQPGKRIEFGPTITKM